MGNPIAQVSGGKATTIITTSSNRLRELGDVNIPNPGAGDTIVFSSITNKWEIAEGNSFGIVNVAGEANVVSTRSSDVLRFRSGTGMLITTDAANGIVDFAATGGSATDATARTIANAAFEEANSAALRANTLVTDNVPETTTNLYFTATRVRSNISNTTPINYDFTTGTISHSDSGANASGYGSVSNTISVIINSTGHVTSITNTPISISATQVTSGILSVTKGGTGQTSSSIANGAILIGNTVSGGYDVNTINQGSGITITNDKGSITIGATGIDQFARDRANAAFVQANSSALRANTLVTDNVPETTTNLYFTATRVRANISNASPINYNSTTGVVSHSDSGVVASGYGLPNAVPTFVVNSTGHVTSITNTPISISATQVTSGVLSVNRGGTGQTSLSIVNGALLVGNTVSGGYDINTLTPGSGISITNDKGSVTISANVTSTTDQFARDRANAAFVQANSSALRANTLVTDNVPETTTNLYFTATRVRSNISNTAPINYNSTTGVISHTDSGVTSTTYGNSQFVSQITVDSKGHITAAFNVAIDRSLAQSASGHANGAFIQANSAALRANTLVTDNVPETTTNLYFTATRVRSNISNTTPINYNSTTGVVSHANSGVIVSGYGNGSSIPVFVVNETGHITSVTNTAVSIATSQITSGVLSVTRGGTGQTSLSIVNGALLVGNTVSGGYDVNTINQGSGITITNDKGSITIGATGAQNSFVTINVAGQSNIIANSPTDTLTIFGGNGVVVTTNSTTDTLTITANVVSAFSKINVSSLSSNTQQNLVAFGMDTLVIQAGSGMNVSTSNIPGDTLTFRVNPGYIQAIASGYGLYII